MTRKIHINKNLNIIYAICEGSNCVLVFQLNWTEEYNLLRRNVFRNSMLFELIRRSSAMSSSDLHCFHPTQICQHEISLRGVASCKRILGPIRIISSITCRWELITRIPSFQLPKLIFIVIIWNYFFAHPFTSARRLCMIELFPKSTEKYKEEYNTPFDPKNPSVSLHIFNPLYSLRLSS